MALPNLNAFTAVLDNEMISDCWTDIMFGTGKDQQLPRPRTIYVQDVRRSPRRRVAHGVHIVSLLVPAPLLYQRAQVSTAQRPADG